MINKNKLFAFILVMLFSTGSWGANHTGTEEGESSNTEMGNAQPETDSFTEATDKKLNGSDAATLSLITKAKEKADLKQEDNLDQFGFGPALYVIKYKKEVLNDSKDVSVKGNNTISSKGSKYATSLGLELHYDFSFNRTLKCFNECEDSENWNLSSGHRISPFLGFYDINSGINGIAAGLVYGYWKGDRNSENKTTLNVGLGWTVHKDRLVLADGISENAIPPADLNVEDYTEKQDVRGVILMISVNMGF